MNEYLEEVIFLSNNGEFISKELIEKIINYRVEQDDKTTKNKFNGVIFGETNWSGDIMCSCDIDSGNIFVDYEKIMSEYIKVTKINMLQKNARIISYLFHEVNHLKEDSIISLLNFESLLISYSSFEVFYSLVETKIKYLRHLINDCLYKKILEVKQDNLYLKIYDKIPSERIANIRSYKETFEIFNNYPNFKEKHLETLKYINEIYRDQYYLGYDNYNKKCKYYNGSLLDYLKIIKMTELLDDFDFYSPEPKIFLKKCSKEFDIEERMLYGLPVTLEETDELDKKLILTK